MSLYQKLKDAVALNSDSRNTLASYYHACKQFYAFCGKPASQWSGPDVQRWLIHLHQEDYSRSSRKNALCALAYVFKHVLKSDMGKLDLLDFGGILTHIMCYEIQLIKQKIREANSNKIRREIIARENAMDLPVSVRKDKKCNDSKSCKRSIEKLRRGQLSFKHKTWLTGKKNARVCGLDLHEAKMLKQELPELSSLGRARDYYFQRLDRGLSEILFVYGCSSIKKTFFRPHQSKWKLRTRQCSVGIKFNSAKQQTNKPTHFIKWSIKNNSSVGISIWTSQKQHIAPLEKWMVYRKSHHYTDSKIATHRLNGVRNLLGHDSIQTTAIYLHADAAEGRSPLDKPMVQPLPDLSALPARLILQK